jgi:hypothetical protein
MKLAEALLLRADAQKRLAQLRQRLANNARVQEGEKPNEDPRDLLAELDRTLATFNELIKRINRTNAATMLDETRTLTDALADRDTLTQERFAISAIIEAASQPSFRLGRSEIKTVNTVDVAALQKRSDDLARRSRELDAAIQQANWNVELM